MHCFIIKGEKNQGKTLFLKKLNDSLKNSGIYPSGFIAEGIIHPAGNKDYILCPLPTGKKVALASTLPNPAYPAAGRFHFNTEAINLGKDLIDKALTQKKQVLIIDEIGPLELKGRVWADSLRKILKSEVPVLVITVRKRIVNLVIEDFDIRNYSLIEPEKIAADQLSKLIRLKLNKAR